MMFLFVVFVLFLAVVGTVVVARSIALSPSADGIPLTRSARASDTPLTPFSTERAQARTLAAQLGGEAKDCSQLGPGWVYDFDCTTRGGIYRAEGGTC